MQAEWKSSKTAAVELRGQQWWVQRAAPDPCSRVAPAWVRTCGGLNPGHALLTKLVL